MPATTVQLDQLEADPLTWRLALFEPYLTDTSGTLIPDGPHHHRFWTWIWAIDRGTRPKPFVGIWPRGGAKSTNAELATIALGARGRRVYAWYISEAQDQADDHVATLGAMLEDRRLATFYPDLASRKVGKYGSSKGWRRNRLRSANGFTIDAVGLDTASRGIKLEEARPDLLVFDDIDGRHDSIATTDKKTQTITETLIPAGAEDRALLFIQNLVHPTSIFSKIADGTADFLTNRILSGPIPAIEDLTYATKAGRTEITGGEPTWVGQDLERCQLDIDEMGITAFLSEAQQEVEAPPGGMFDHLDLAQLRIAYDDVPPLTRVVCWVDPAVTKTDQSDAHAIQIDGIDGDARSGTIYRLYSWEQRATPLESITRAIRKAALFGARYVGVETDQGGDTWESVFREARRAALETATAEEEPKIRRLLFREAKAGQGDQPKAGRAAIMLADYERPGLRIRHVIGTNTILENALRRFPRTKPLDLVDASYWSWDDLRQGLEVAAATDPAPEPGDPDPYTAERHSRLWD